jgi:hypothetical protein
VAAAVRKVLDDPSAIAVVLKAVARGHRGFHDLRPGATGRQPAELTAQETAQTQRFTPGLGKLRKEWWASSEKAA